MGLILGSPQIVMLRKRREKVPSTSIVYGNSAKVDPW